jgi:hypothetical protein
MVPTDEMIVDATNPQSKWKLPVAETFAISAALLIVFFFSHGLFEFLS